MDARADAVQHALSGTNITGWAHRAKLTFFSSPRFPPLAAPWLSILAIVLAGALWSHRRRMRPAPGMASTRWRLEGFTVEGARKGHGDRRSQP